jgi:hypothetical protein
MNQRFARRFLDHQISNETGPIADPPRPESDKLSNRAGYSDRFWCNGNDILTSFALGPALIPKVAGVDPDSSNPYCWSQSRCLRGARDIARHHRLRELITRDASLCPTNTLAWTGAEPVCSPSSPPRTPAIRAL